MKAVNKQSLFQKFIAVNLLNVESREKLCNTTCQLSDSLNGFEVSSLLAYR
jgi:hypothetical protein